MRVLRSALAVLLLLYVTLLWAGADDAVSTRPEAPDIPGLAAPLRGRDLASLSLETGASHWLVPPDQLVVLGHPSDVLRSALRLPVTDVGLHTHTSASDEPSAGRYARFPLLSSGASVLVATTVPEPGTGWLVLVGLGILYAPRLRARRSELRE